MKFKTTTLLSALAAGLLAIGSVAQAQDRRFECYDEGVQPKAKSTKSREAVKAEISGKTYSCFEEMMEPKAKSTKERAAVQKETKAAVKAGEIPRGEAMTKQK